MIECCSAKRMLASIIFLGGLTFLILVIESHLTGNNRTTEPEQLNLTSSNCWLQENFEIIEQCQPCSDFEIKSQSNEACKETHYKETVQCKSKGKFYRSCAKVSWIEEEKFWKFECAVFIFSVIFTYIVFFRQRVLNERVMRRIQKRLASYP